MNQQWNYYACGEYGETTEESVFRYSPELRNQKVMSYMQDFFGMPKLNPDGNGRKQIPVMGNSQGAEFRFDALVEAYYCYPFFRPEEHFMLIVNSESTLFAYGHNQKTLIVPYIFELNLHEHNIDYFDENEFEEELEL